MFDGNPLGRVDICSISSRVWRQALSLVGYGELIDKMIECLYSGCLLKSGWLLAAKSNWKCNQKLLSGYLVQCVMLWFQKKGRTNLWIEALRETLMLKEVAQSLNPYVSCSQMLAFENQLNEQYLLRVLRKIPQIKKKKMFSPTHSDQGQKLCS